MLRDHGKCRVLRKTWINELLKIAATLEALGIDFMWMVWILYAALSGFRASFGEGMGEICVRLLVCPALVPKNVKTKCSEHQKKHAGTPFALHQLEKGFEDADWDSFIVI